MWTFVALAEEGRVTPWERCCWGHILSECLRGSLMEPPEVCSTSQKRTQSQRSEVSQLLCS